MMKYGILTSIALNSTLVTAPSIATQPCRFVEQPILKALTRAMLQQCGSATTKDNAGDG